jgi:hypothetical protein
MLRRHFSALLLALAAFIRPAAAAQTAGQLIDALGPDLRPSPALISTPSAEIEAAATLALKALIDADPKNPSLLQRDTFGRTPLMRAAFHGYADMVDVLLTNALVRSQLDLPDRFGASAWALSQLAMPLTQLSCQPAMLARMRAPLWRPYVSRAAYFWSDGAQRFERIGRALQAAGARTEPSQARAYWLRRCATPGAALKASLDDEANLLKHLSADAVGHLQMLSTILRSNEPLQIAPVASLDIAQRTADDDALSREFNSSDAPLPATSALCTQMAKPKIPVMRWRGTASFRIVAEVFAGTPIWAQFDPLEPDIDPEVAARLQYSIQEALASYRCPGDHVFEQRFDFRIR